jgi:hypothetical protein
MPRAYRAVASRPKTTKKSSMRPTVYMTRRTARDVNEVLTKWPERVEEAKLLVTMQAARIVLDEIIEKAPKIGDYKYAKDLEIVEIDGLSRSDGDVGVAIVFSGKPREISEDDDETAIFVKRKRNSPAFVDVLSEFGPWPAKMLPLKIDEKDAQLIARRMRPDEKGKLEARIMKSRGKIEKRLSAAGLKDVKIQRGSGAATGTTVQDDIGFAVLRKEFGFEGKQDAHWRPAFRALKSKKRDLHDRFVKYVETGNEMVFDLGPEGSSPITASKFSKTTWFQDEIAKKL